MTSTKKTQAQPVLLSASNLKELGSELTDIMNILSMNNLALEGLEFAQDKDTAVALWQAKKYNEVAYTQNDKLINKLDKIAFQLLHSDNAEELEGLDK